MILSRTDLLAIVSVVDIAVHGQDGPVRARDIERRHGLSRRYLNTTLQTLTSSGVLTGREVDLGAIALRARLTASQ